MKITKMVAGKKVDVPIESVWNSICKVIRLARLASFRSDETDYLKFHEARISFLKERLDDFDGLTFEELNDTP